MSWQLLRSCGSLSISDREVTEIPGRPGSESVGGDPDFTGSSGPGRPLDIGGLSVFETLHLVSDNPKRYKMF
ncbi:Uncharacterised protein [Mycolicibacterium gilvum]|uniref:Uncharacterized protein n=2 Tax=Mycolicibacterium gilvum TaxID=1804 RepID=E6TJB4_MYCSR|nr:hypothetical protein Mspyr1_36510 [Mycolicibacterium gilvum Spyr1]STZ42700.1 Uncharacterised protein [Mycolicibacterium gilvum]